MNTRVAAIQTNKMIKKLLFTISSVFSLAASANSPIPSTSIPFVEHSATIDGKLDEPHWRLAKKIAIDNITWPQENLPSPVKTTAYVYENGQSLFVAFDARDPHPEQIRAFFRDRDKGWNDDLVGIKIDSFNNAKSA
jgi:hypothetical protein